MPAPIGNQYALGHHFGRPTKYEEDMPARVIGYLQETMENPSEIPWLEDVAIMCGVSEQTITAWQKEHKDFLEACNKLMTVQKKRLKKGGITSEFAPNFTKFLLSADHNMREGTDLTSGGEKLETGVVTIPQKNG